MRLPEQKLWDWLRPRLEIVGFVERVENRVGVGTPDLYFSHLGLSGWIELKVLAKWPAPGREVRITHWTGQQRNWALNHAKRGGGRTWLVLRVDDEVIVADAARFAPLGDDPTEEQIRDRWPMLTIRHCTTGQVIEALRKSC